MCECNGNICRKSAAVSSKMHEICLILYKYIVCSVVNTRQQHIPDISSRYRTAYYDFIVRYLQFACCNLFPLGMASGMCCNEHKTNCMHQIANGIHNITAVAIFRISMVRYHNSPHAAISNSEELAFKIHFVMIISFGWSFIGITLPNYSRSCVYLLCPCHISSEYCLVVYTLFLAVACWFILVIMIFTAVFLYFSPSSFISTLCLSVRNYPNLNLQALVVCVISGHVNLRLYNFPIE